MDKKLRNVKTFAVKPMETSFSENALGFLNKHFLDQVSDQGFWKTTPRKSSNGDEVIKQIERTVLHGSVSITDIQDIDPINETFRCILRLYLVWEVDFHNLGLECIADKALDNGHFYSMSHHEIEKFSDIFDIPEVDIFNVISKEHTDPADIRVYGGNKGCTAVMWNRSFNVVVRQRYNLKYFPFDYQTLNLEFRLNNAKTWDKFELVFNCVQFSKTALQMAEWECHSPSVHSGLPKHKVANVHLTIARFASYYLQNVVAVMFCLSMLSLVSFAMDVSDLGSRVSTCLTLLLTKVAFKFILAGSLPKVPYNTLIDYFVIGSMLFSSLTTVFSILPHIVTQDIEVQDDINGVLAITSVCILAGSVLSWLLYAYRWTHLRKTTERVVVKADKNWYSYRFASPPFLLPISA